MDIHKAVVNGIRLRRNFYIRKNTFEVDIDEALSLINVTTEGRCNKKYNWMTMSDLGEPLANTVSTPVFLFSIFGSQTFLPSFCAPNNNPPIFISYIHELRHFVVVKFYNTSIYPVWQQKGFWRRNAQPEALAWEKKYARFVNYWK